MKVNMLGEIVESYTCVCLRIAINTERAPLCCFSYYGILIIAFSRTKQSSCSSTEDPSLNIPSLSPLLSLSCFVLFSLPRFRAFLQWRTREERLKLLVQFVVSSSSQLALVTPSLFSVSSIFDSLSLSLSLYRKVLFCFVLYFTCLFGCREN